MRQETAKKLHEALKAIVERSESDDEHDHFSETFGVDFDRAREAVKLADREEPKEPGPLFFCRDCGSPEIESEMWVGLNDEELCGDSSGDGDCWCRNCNAHTGIKLKEEDRAQEEAAEVRADAVLAQQELTDFAQDEVSDNAEARSYWDE